MDESTPPHLDHSTRLALDRTQLAHERTLMAWVRTAVSLITFGFTIYKFFELEIKRTQAHLNPVIGPRGFALIMISIGLVALSLASIQHRASLKQLTEMFGTTLPRSVAGPVAALVAVMGVLALIAVIVRA